MQLRMMLIEVCFGSNTRSWAVLPHSPSPVHDIYHGTLTIPCSLVLISSSFIQNVNSLIASSNYRDVLGSCNADCHGEASPVWGPLLAKKEAAGVAAGAATAASSKCCS